MDLDEFPDPMPPTQTNNDFEDHMSHYDKLSIGCAQPLSRVSTSSQIHEACESKKKRFMEDIRKAHPDQNQGVDGGTQDINEAFQSVRNTCNLIKSKTGTISGRLAHDLKCDSLVKSWRAHVKHNEEGAKDQFATDQMIQKCKETKEKKAALSAFENCVELCKPSGAQSTGWKMACFKAINEENYSQAAVVRHVRNECGSRNWNGRSTEKEHQTIRSKVKRALDSLNSKKFNMDEFEKLGPKEAEVVLKRKKTSSNPDRSTSKVLPKAQDEMEKKLHGHVESLWKEKKRVSRLVVVRKVVEIYPMFKGGMHDPKFMANIKSWFHHGFCKRVKLSYTRIAGASRNLPSNWKELAASVIARVAKSQAPRR